MKSKDKKKCKKCNEELKNNKNINSNASYDKNKEDKENTYKNK